MENKDKVTLTITLERKLNGTSKRTLKIEGEGFHYFEMIGLLQMTCYDLAKSSVDVGKELPEDKKVKLVFGEGDKKE